MVGLTKKIRSLVLCLFFAAAFCGNVFARETISQSIQSSGLTRHFLLHIPDSYQKNRSAALVFVFHGGGGDAKQAEKYTKFSRLSELEGFIAVYPNAIDKNWNDGRNVKKFRSQRENIDDVGFVLSILDTLKSSFNIDRHRVFITGVSNGAIFCHFLANKASGNFLAMASVIGSMAKPAAKHFNPARPISVLMINGTKDPLVPYKGGGVGFLGKRGKVVGVEACVKLWGKHNQCRPTPAVEILPDVDPKDGTRVTKMTYSNPRNQTEVVFYKIKNGGHNWPGGKKYLPDRIVGKVCRDIDATTVIWDFFKRRPRR